MTYLCLFRKNIRKPVSFVLMLALYVSSFCLTAQAAEVTETDNPTAEESAWNTRYAVSVYGILVDPYQGSGEKKAGLTFGPATGNNYTNSYQAHIPEDTFREDPQKNICIHWMTWEQIAEQSKTDPTVFHDCLVSGCTHSVDICLNDTLKRSDFSGLKGDGASGLLDSIRTDFQVWNGGRICKSGWPGSRIRMTLNGADELLNVSEAGSECVLTEKDCLFSCFPEDLQTLIVPKAVVSDLDYDGEEGNCVTTYDKLWLFSPCEIYGDIRMAKTTEGEQYERNALIPYKGHGQRPEFQMFSESGQIVWAWFRSTSQLNDVMNFHIFGGGHDNGTSYYNHFALTPGFCLE